MEAKYSEEYVIRLLFKANSRSEPNNDVSIAEIDKIMSNCTCGAFQTACRALHARGGKEDFQLLEKYIDSSDDFERRSALRYILYFSIGKEKYSRRVSELLQSNEVYTLRGALELIQLHKMNQNDNSILDVIEKHISQIGTSSIYSLHYIPDINSVFDRIIALYQNCSKQQRETLAECIFELVNAEHFEKAFDLLASDSYHKVRLYAVKLAIKHEHFALLERFINEKEGHIRTLAQKYYS